MSATSITRPFPYLLLPSLWASRNRARRREKGDLVRGVLFGGVGLGVIGALFLGAFWLTWQAAQYAELGDYLIRIGLSWLFLTFLSFLAFSGIVAALSTFFLSDDLRLVLAAPVAPRRLFLARFARTVVQAGWMVAVFLVPVLAGIATAKCASPFFVVTALLTIVPFVVIPIAMGSAVTLLLVNVFPARRARDILMLMGLVFATSIVLAAAVHPARAAVARRVDAGGDGVLRHAAVADHADAAVVLGRRGAVCGPAGRARSAAHRRAVDHGGGDGRDGRLGVRALALHRLQQGAGGAQGALYAVAVARSRSAGCCRCPPVRKHLLIKDLKVFLRDVSQWSQLLLLVALMLVYLYNFRVLDLDRMPYMSGFLKNVYAFLNLAMASFVMSTVTVRFVFPAVSAEGAAFWIIRTAPISLRDFLWSKFWTGLVPILILTESLIIAGNELLGVDPFLKRMSAVAIVFMAFALVGLGTGLGARYPRFAADNPSQVAGSYGGVAFMIVAVLFILVMIVLLGWPSSVYLFSQLRNRPLTSAQEILIAAMLHQRRAAQHRDLAARHAHRRPRPARHGSHAVVELKRVIACGLRDLRQESMRSDVD